MRPAFPGGMTVQSDVLASPETRKWYAVCSACLWESDAQDVYENAYMIADSPLSHHCKRPARRRGRA